MKLAYWLLLFSACAGQSAEMTSPSGVVASCPACPDATCSMAVCPHPPCPACPARVPSTASSWYCKDLHTTDGRVLGFCWPDLDVCQQKRKQAATDKLGKTTPCVAQRIAYCVGITFPLSISWMAYCARTPENCERNREVLLKEFTADKSRVRPCQRTLNIDPHESMRAPPPSEEIR